MGRSIRSGAKSIALFGAVLILAAQFLALTHFHRGNPTRQLSAQTVVAADDGLCALCILAFHAPLNPAATPALERPLVDVRLVDAAVVRPRTSDSHALCQTRAPPPALV
jgi:hypothetical protein